MDEIRLYKQSISWKYYYRLLRPLEDLMTRFAFESRFSAMKYTEMHDFVDLNSREHKGKPQCRFMYPALMPEFKLRIELTMHHKFESNAFHSGEGANIPRLRAEAKENKRKEKPRSKPPVALETADPSRILVERINQVTTDSIHIKFDKEKETSQFSTQSGVPEQNPMSASKPETKIVKSISHTDKRIPPDEKNSQKSAELQRSMEDKADDKMDDKTKSAEKKTISHLQGSKLLLSIRSHRTHSTNHIPFLSFQTVKSHRALRQSIRLAGVVETFKRVAPSVLNEEKEAEIRTQARYHILQQEIYEGLILLHEYGIVEKMREPVENSWLHSLKELHRKRRSSVSGSPGGLEWLERFLDAIEIVLRREDDSSTDHYLRKQESLMEYYIKPNDEEGLHASRTLDQHYYSAIADTSRRDVDQVARRYQARRVAERSQETSKARMKSLSLHDRVMKIRETQNFLEKHMKKNKTPLHGSRVNDDIGWEDDPGAKIAMVDQLWLWIVDDAKARRY
ncbi:hypothetical protein HYALB_00010140 [Hymenoscyphus albidus]|uniref:Uncharacterized protein n=1 Tax=Hymenoscyphus albidus TaxID=595503 RepID=A0A9N9L9R4_9HELO|nr:hypothetical protein HYALB_00010140 [Hymenoscyphus albidus]